MKATGMLFLSRTPPALNKDVRGQWVVTLLCVDRIANHQTEPWKLIWKGQQAADWLDLHRAKLQPGTPLAVVAENIRTRPVGAFSEISARVLLLAMAGKGVAHA